MYSNTTPTNGKVTPSVTPNERAIALIHGQDAHTIIVDMLQQGMSHTAISKALASEEHDFYPSVSWVNQWVHAHYRKVERWERRS